MFCNTFCFILPTNHEARDVLEEEQGDATLLCQFNEMRAFHGTFAEQHTVIGENSNRNTPDMRKAAGERTAIERLKFLKL